MWTAERGRLTEGGPVGEDDADVEEEEEGDAEDEGDREDGHHHQLDLVRRRLPQLPLGKAGRTYHSSRWSKAAQNSQIRHKYQKVPQLSWGRKAAKLKYNASTTAAARGRSLKVVQCIQRMYHSCHLRKVEEGLTVNTMHVPQLLLEEGLTVNRIQVPQLSLEEGLTVNTMQVPQLSLEEGSETLRYDASTTTAATAGRQRNLQ